MRTLTGWIRCCSVIGVAAMLAACAGNSGGGGVVPAQQGASSVAHAQAAQSLASESIDDATPDAKCKSSGKDISVKPCIVTFLLLDLKPADVKVKSTVKKASVSESDDCASKGIAVITGGPAAYTVTPGLTAGTCEVKFSSEYRKRKLGTATLTVNNAN